MKSGAETFYREQEGPKNSETHQPDPGADYKAEGPSTYSLPGDTHKTKPPGNNSPEYKDQFPGSSAKVIPTEMGEMIRDQLTYQASASRVASRFGRRTKSAATLDDILGKTGPQVHDRAKGLQVDQKRFNPKTGFWTFAVTGSSGESYTVRIKGIRKSKNVKQLIKASVKCSCTCQFWRWQGPEHWGKTNDFLYGRARGTASVPVIKDPKEKHWACKHLVAALELARAYRWASASEWSLDGPLAPLPSPEAVSRRYAGRFSLTEELVGKFRKDFLLLMKNTSRIDRDEERLAVWRKAMRKWHKRFEEFGAQIRSDLEGRIRVNKGKPDYQQTVNIPWAQHYLDQNKAFWDFAWELRSMPELGDLDGESLEALRQRLIDGEWNRGKDPAQVAEETDRYIENALARGHIKTPEMVAAKSWDKWEEEVRKWANRIKSKARSGWKWLIDLAEWTERGGLHGGGQEAIELLEPTIEALTLEGFSMRFVGFPEAGDWLQAYLPSFKAGLGQFRARAGKVFPWMLQHMLPLEVQWSGESLNSRDAAATYERNHITVTLWGASAKPKRVVHVLAHEMGHHVFQTLLSGAQQKDWKTFIKGDYTDLDLRDVMARMRSGESTHEFSDRIEREDPILHIQIEATLHHHASRHWDLLNVAGIQDHLDAGRPAVIRVPANPITGYANKNPEEAFCEALGKLVAFGPRTLPDIVNWWMRQMLPNLKLASQRSLPSPEAVSRRYASEM